MSDKVIIEIQKAGASVQVIPMSEGSPMYKIVANGRTIVENITSEDANRMIQKARDKVILG